MTVLIHENRQSFLDDLHKISALSDGWEISYNVEKCPFFHVGTRNKLDYGMCDAKLISVQCVNDLGVKIPSNFKFLLHCTDVANKLNKMLGFEKKKSRIKQ